MDAAAARLEGRHDFAAFQTAGAETHTTERERVLVASHRASRPLITYDVRGDGFLRHMVRSIVGTLVEVGRGRYPSGMDDGGARCPTIARVPVALRRRRDCFWCGVEYEHARLIMDEHVA